MLLRRPELAARRSTPGARQLAYERALAVCDAADARSAAEQLPALGTLLACREHGKDGRDELGSLKPSSYSRSRLIACDRRGQSRSRRRALIAHGFERVVR